MTSREPFQFQSVNRIGVGIELYIAITVFYKVQLKFILYSLHIWYHSAKSKISCNKKNLKLGAFSIKFYTLMEYLK